MKHSVRMMVIETGPGLWEFQKVLSLIFVWCFFWPGVVYFQELLILICLKYLYVYSLYNDADMKHGRLKHKDFQKAVVLYLRMYLQYKNVIK